MLDWLPKRRFLFRTQGSLEVCQHLHVSSGIGLALRSREIELVTTVLSVARDAVIPAVCRCAINRPICSTYSSGAPGQNTEEEGGASSTQWSVILRLFAFDMNSIE